MEEVRISIDAGMLACICGYVRGFDDNNHPFRVGDVFSYRRNVVRFFKGYAVATSGRSMAFMKINTSGFKNMHEDDFFAVRFTNKAISAMRGKDTVLQIKIEARIFNDTQQEFKSSIICDEIDFDGKVDDGIAFTRNDINFKRIIGGFETYKLEYAVRIEDMFPFITGVKNHKIDRVVIAGKEHNRALIMKIVMLAKRKTEDRHFWAVFMPALPFENGMAQELVEEGAGLSEGDEAV